MTIMLIFLSKLGAKFRRNAWLIKVAMVGSRSKYIFYRKSSSIKILQDSHKIQGITEEILPSMIFTRYTLPNLRALDIQTMEKEKRENRKKSWTKNKTHAHTK